MGLRPYQEEAVKAILGQWDSGVQRTLLVLPTGCGKTICFASVAENEVRRGKRVLILAHRGELLEQAADKIHSFTGLNCSVEKAEQSSLGTWERITVGSVQTLQSEKRMTKMAPDRFGTIIVDEAHHVLSDSYQRIFDYFNTANVLGVTATPDRGDMRNLGQFFQSLAYEYTLPRAIKDGYLCKIKAQTIPINLDMDSVGMSAGDFKAADVGSALEPYLEAIADEMAGICQSRKTVVFLPLIDTSIKFTKLLNDRGFRAAEVNGGSADRAEILRDFANGKYNVLCNSMLLTEGWDCPSVDCIVVLRPTKVRGLYCLDESTEILTANGWKRDVEPGEMVASFNLETEKIEFSHALAKIRRHLEPDEYFCHIKGQSTDIRVTNKHRIVYGNKRKIKWSIDTAEKVAAIKDGAYIPVSGKNDFPGVPLTDDEIKFIAWVMTDGTINKSNGAIAISQSSNQPWLEEIQKCIDGCGLKYGRAIRNSKTQFKRNHDNIVWTISHGKPRGRDSNKRGWAYLEKFISKDISPALFNMSESQFDTMLEVIHFADGSKQESQSWKRRSYHIHKGNKKFIENLQIMAVQRGYRANLAEIKNSNGKTLYSLHLKKTRANKVGAISGNHSTWVKEPHTDESCWCVETKNGTLVTRRNGKVAIVGNCQMVGRGTRLSPGKDHLLILDFLWHTSRHELCRPACLICETPEVAAKMTEKLEQQTDDAADIEQLALEAQKDAIAEREAALAEELRKQRGRKRALVDPLQFEMSIQAEDLAGYVPTFPADMGPPTPKQIELLEKRGIYPDEIENFGKANLIIDRLIKRQKEGLTTPKQIRLLEKMGFIHVGEWEFQAASKMISRISMNNWRIPRGVIPAEYKPERTERSEDAENEPFSIR